MSTKLEAKVVASCEHYTDHTPENTLKEGTCGYASPVLPFSGEVFIVYDLLSVKRLTTFQLQNPGSSDQIVKIFSLYGGNTQTGPWTIALDRASAKLSAYVGEFKIPNTLEKFRFWKLLLLENNGRTTVGNCKFWLQGVGFLGY
ncbi:hypothetical protein Pelo_17763 [Pelomyxa schiedti]|nr:hypothetical protein Pelo_17763 [Pelomyxa schiedti]